MTPLGKFEALPYEARELIWLELAPTGHDTRREKVQKTGLGILCASLALNREISRLVYQKASLEFDVTPSHQPGQVWSTVHFTNKHLSKVHQGKDSSTWILKSLEDACSRGFDHLPFHKISDITVNLYAVDPQRGWKLFTLWKKASELVCLLKKATRIQRLAIRLQKRDRCDWVDREQSANRSFNRYFDHELVVMPFFTIRSVRTIGVEAHSPEVDDNLPWAIIDRAMDACHSYGDDSAERGGIDYQVSWNYYWMHRQFWYFFDRGVPNRMRRDFLRELHVQGPSGHSQFGREMVWILYMYPAIAQELDPNMFFLSEIHWTMVCLYHYAMKKRGKKVLGQEWDWDREAWDSYSKGIPPSTSREYAKQVEPYLDEELYDEYLGDCSSFFTIIPGAIKDWFHREE